jgi:hypothetical protein
MKKTILILTMVLLLVPAGLFAGVFDLSLGVTAQNKMGYDATSGEFDEDMFTDVENYAFGGDIRMRLLFAEVGIMGLYSQTAAEETRIDGILTGGLSLDLLGLVRVGLGMGPRMTVVEETGGWKVYGPDNTAIDEDTDFESALMNAPMTYRATVDLKLGKILLGLNYTVDSNGFTFDEPNPVNLMPDDAAWGNGRIGASVLFTIF